MNSIPFALVFLICSVLTDLLKASDSVEGYYWRDYVTGNVPKDAFLGGTDANGIPVYIGQFYHTRNVFPGIIRQTEETQVHNGGRLLSPAPFIKILCTQHPEDFEWITSDTSHVHNLAVENLVLGGYAPSKKRYAYIGRTNSKGKVIVGAIAVVNSVGLRYTRNEVTVIYNSFEVLSYNPKVHANTGNTNSLLTG